MTVDDWRSQRLHRRCENCVYALLKHTGPGFCFCRAKQSTKDQTVPRPFCGLFTLRLTHKENQHGSGGN